MEHKFNIFQRILNLMGDLDYIQKGNNKVAGQYRFVSHDQVSAKVHPLLVKHGIAVIPSVEGFKQEGNRTEVKMVIAFRNCDDLTDGFSINSFGYGIDSGDKGPGKAVSYAYKMALLKIFCLETGEDPDYDQEAHHEPGKCLEFDSLLPIGFTEQNKMKKFLLDISKSTGKNVEDIKREAVKRIPDFMEAFNKWVPKKKETE